VIFLETPEFEKLKQQISFNLSEKRVVDDLGINPDAFLPVLFSLKFGGDWSFKTVELESLAVKEKITRYDDVKEEGYTLERVTLFINPSLISSRGKVLRLEKCGNKRERQLVERPFRVELDAEDIIFVEMNPGSMEITLRRVSGPLAFEGSAAYGVSHEIEHLTGCELTGKFFYQFKYIILED
jgi:predicted metalloprotease